jgi:hypothetical protein
MDAPGTMTLNCEGCPCPALLDPPADLCNGCGGNRVALISRTRSSGCGQHSPYTVRTSENGTGLTQFCSFLSLAIIQGQEIRPHAQYLPGLHKSRAGFFNGKPYPPVHGGGFWRTFMDCIPFAGLMRKCLVQRTTRTIYSQDSNGPGDPLDLRVHMHLYAFMILQVCLHSSAGTGYP